MHILTTPDGKCKVPFRFRILYASRICILLTRLPVKSRTTRRLPIQDDDKSRTILRQFQIFAFISRVFVAGGDLIASSCGTITTRRLERSSLFMSER